MVETIFGNLLDFPPYCKTDPDKYLGINAIAHSCNTRNIMGGGIALQIKNRYPQAYEADTKAYNQEYDHNGQYIHWLGKYSKAEINSKFLPNDKGYIYNMYNQASIGRGRQVDYEHFLRALKGVEQDLYEMNVTKHEYDPSAPPVLGLPYGISCGLAGGSWNIVKELINEIFLDSPIKCYIVKFELA
tara:strand:- start:1221 stop:1781 length:561 start_codon:yes stop_codon:yes gene_type:complete